MFKRGFSSTQSAWRQSSSLRTVTNNTRFAFTSNSNVFFCPASFYSTQTEDNNVDAKPLVVDLFKKAKYRNIVHALEGDDRVKLPYKEFVEICGAHAVDEAEAKKLVSSLHESGKFLHYAHSKELSEFVFLKPDDLAQSFAKLLDLSGQFTQGFVAKKQEELESLTKEVAAFEEKKQQLTQRATRAADSWLAFSLLLLGAQGFAVARLTWWELSWDIMEPVTYMLTFSAVFGGFVYFNFSKRDYTYEALRERMIAKRLNKYLAKEGLDAQHIEKVKAKIAEIKQHLKAPEVAFLLK